MKKIANMIRALIMWARLRRMNRLTGWRYFRRECRRANEMAHFNKKRYRVFLLDKYRALSRDDVQRMKNYGQLSKREATGILSKNAFYDTETRANTHPEFSNRKI